MNDFINKMNKYIELKNDVRSKMMEIANVIIKYVKYTSVESTIRVGYFIINCDSDTYCCYITSESGVDEEILKFFVWDNKNIDCYYKKKDLNKILTLYSLILKEGCILADRLIEEENKTLKQLDEWDI